MEYMSLNQAPIDAVLVALQTGQVYTKDLSTQQQTELYDTMQHELDTARAHGTGELGGIATRAFLLSMQRAIKYGVRTMGRNERSPIGIVDYDDCVQEYFVQVSTDWHIGLRNKERRASTLVMHRARAVAQRVLRAQELPGLVFPFNLNAQGVMTAYEEAIEQGALLKDDKDYTAILIKAQVNTTYLNSPNTPRLVKDIVRAKDLEPLHIEHITDDDEWEYRCNIDSDTCDDEWVGHSNEPSELSDFDAFDYLGLFEKLPWYLLSDKQKDVTQKYFGLTGNPPMNMRDIACDIGCTYQNISLMINKSLALLRRKTLQSIQKTPVTDDTNITTVTTEESDTINESRAYFLANYLHMENEDFIKATLSLLPVNQWSISRFERMAKKGQYPPFSQIKNRFGGQKAFVAAAKSLQLKKPKAIVPDPWVKI